MSSRRGFLLGLGAALAAPSIVRAESLMKLWVPVAPKFYDYSYLKCDHLHVSTWYDSVILPPTGSAGRLMTVLNYGPGRLTIALPGHPVLRSGETAEWVAA